jgi:hypothetical protein
VTAHTTGLARNEYLFPFSLWEGMWSFIVEISWNRHMSLLEWKRAEDKLKALLNNTNPLDIYLILNIVVPLRERYYNGERSLRLYNEIMNFRMPAPVQESKER